MLNKSYFGRELTSLDASFVQRDGNSLVLDQEPFRFGGANIYWLGLDENVGGIQYPTYYRIRNALLTARSLGSVAIRSHLGISTGHPLSLEPSRGHFNNEAFRTIDYAVYQSGQLGLRLIIPFTDNWQYYHGGESNFTGWFGVEPSEFYTNPQVVDAYEQYIEHFIHHVNPYTGRAYKDDPTVMAWELGNELNGMPQAWIERISAYIHQLAPRQLIAAGKQFGINPATLHSPFIDIVDVHYYPPTADKIQADAKTVADAGKVYIAGEYASTAASSELLTPLASDKHVTGAMFWSLFGHNDTYGYVQHDDGFTLHVPGDTPRMKAEVQSITTFNRAMGAGLKLPQAPQETPYITSITKRHANNVIAWRGAAGAVGYSVEVAVDGPNGPWNKAGNEIVTDQETPWLDKNSPRTAAWYRVAAVYNNGKIGKFSGATAVGSAAANLSTLADPLESWQFTYSHSEGLEVFPRDGGVRIAPRIESLKADDSHQITWYHAGLEKFQLHVESSSSPIPMTVYTSSDDTNWIPVHPAQKESGKHQYVWTMERLNGIPFLKVEWDDPEHSSKLRETPAVTGAVLYF